ncbi:DUF202 domain-containing protein [Candidatus Fermentibacteria bacterium]|nr:DUF202 domain-containing protein [Candidatus Fermentibacteria bacterium]
MVGDGSVTESCILRDNLAWRRTALANERTLLAYIRTALALVVAGVSAVKLLDQSAWQAAGLATVAGGLFIGAAGFLRYASVRKSIGRPPEGSA